MTSLAPTLQAFFTERLAQRCASPHTVASYRDSWRLLLGFAERHIGKAPAVLDLEDLDAPLIGAFLEHLEAVRHNSPRTRNARLAAVHSFFHFAAFTHPEHAALIQRVLAIPQSVSIARSSHSSPGQSSRRCWQHRIARPGSAVAITPC